MTSLSGRLGEIPSILLQIFSHILAVTLCKPHTSFIQHRPFQHHQLSLDHYHTFDEIIHILTKRTNHVDHCILTKCHIRYRPLKRPHSPGREGHRLIPIAHLFFMHQWSAHTKRVSSADECLPHHQGPWISWPRSVFWVSVSANRVYDAQLT